MSRPYACECFLFLALLCSSTLAESMAGTVALQGQIFGTSYNIRIRGASLDEDALHAAVSTRLNEIDRRMSTWREDSDVSRFNVSESTEWFPVSEDTVRVVALGPADF